MGELKVETFFFFFIWIAGSYKLNTRCVSSGDQGSSGYGGILRDENGCWIRGFTGHLGTASMCIEAELLAILKGVELIDCLRLQNTTLETDSLDAFKALEKPDMYTRSSVWMEKISDCLKLVKKNEITLSSITPEENKCARFLAQLAMDEEEDDDDDYADVLDPPPGIESLIMADKPKLSND